MNLNPIIDVDEEKNIGTWLSRCIREKIFTKPNLFTIFKLITIRWTSQSLGCSFKLPGGNEFTKKLTREMIKECMFDGNFFGKNFQLIFFEIPHKQTYTATVLFSDNQAQNYIASGVFPVFKKDIPLITKDLTATDCEFLTLLVDRLNQTLLENPFRKVMFMKQ